MQRRDFLKIVPVLLALSFAPRCLAALPLRTPGHSGENFKHIYLNQSRRNEFFSFLHNVFSIYPDQAMHELIYQIVQTQASDADIYKELQRRLPEITPFLNIVTHALPALTKQKKEMAEQAGKLLASDPKANGYLEIGTTGRYAHGIEKTVQVSGPTYVVNKDPPSYSPDDIADRGQISHYGTYIALNDYANIARTDIPAKSLDLVSNYIGFHHAAPDQRDHFIRSVTDTIRPGGRLLLRDHDATTKELKFVVALAHDVFNAGIHLTWKQNAAEVRNFVPMAEIEDRLYNLGLRRRGPLLLQDGDPTRNALMVFQKV